tara:strand:- start:177 stop:689 length:513 start_codon:yes stop_codon:yes gene_type:complete
MTWRKIILDKGKFERTTLSLFCRANPDSYQLVLEEVPDDVLKICGPLSEMCHLRRRDARGALTFPLQNHPLVEKGLAYWINNTTLVTGYRLLGRPKNKEIYRPIFQIEREKLYFRLRDEIKKFAKFYAAEKRQKLYQKILMNIEELKMIPKCIIMKIAHLTYDPFSYLKL